MNALAVVLLLDLALLQFGGVCSEDIVHYSRVGEETTLLCDKFKDHGPNCSDIRWNHWTNTSHSFVVWRWKIQKSPRSHRLRFNSDCSLTVHNITVEDYGRYACALWTSDIALNWENKNFYLRVLSVSPAPSSLNQPGHITLQCTMWRKIGWCRQNSFRWLDVNGTVLSGESVTQNNCVSRLTVDHQSHHHRTFSCQFVEDGKVQVSAELRLKRNSSEKVSETSCSSWFLVLKTVGWGALICTTVAVSICTREKEKPKRSSGVFEMVIDPEFNPGNMAPPADYENQQ